MTAMHCAHGPVRMGGARSTPAPARLREDQRFDSLGPTQLGYQDQVIGNTGCSDERLTCSDGQRGGDVGPARLAAGLHPIQHPSLQPSHLQSRPLGPGAPEQLLTPVNLHVDSAARGGTGAPGHMEAAAGDIEDHEVSDGRAACEGQREEGEESGGQRQQSKKRPVGDTG